MFQKLINTNSLIHYSKKYQNFLDKSDNNICCFVKQGDLTKNQFKMVSKTVTKRKHFTITTLRNNFILLWGNPFLDIQWWWSAKILCSFLIHENECSFLHKHFRSLSGTTSDQCFFEETKQTPVLHIISFIYVDNKIAFITCNLEIIVQMRNIDKLLMNIIMLNKLIHIEEIMT